MNDSCPPLPRPLILVAWVGMVAMLACSGCRQSDDDVRRIKRRVQQRVQTASRPDHLQQVQGLLDDFVTLDQREASGQIAYHLNEWLADQPRLQSEAAAEVPPIATTLDLLDRDGLAALINDERFNPNDARFLRDSFVLERLIDWIDTETRDDPLLSDWMAEQRSTLSGEQFDQLQVASRMFDWVVRNVALEPDLLTDPANSPAYPFGMTLGGPGYRQTTFETIFRGRGDRLQRTNVFTRLCHHAGVDAAVLAIRQNEESTALSPWAVGVLIGNEVYLYETMLGVHVPGPDQRGIATLAQARSDASVMRRLNVAGFYNYPLDKQDVQQNIALLNVRPEQLTVRMRTLQASAVGPSRMRLHVDAQSVGDRFDAATGVAGARLWNQPLLSEIYQAHSNEIAAQDPRFANMMATQWYLILGNGSGSGEKLSLARWKQLRGEFDDQVDRGVDGARTLLLNQRAPEFQIDDLRTNLDLQKAYGLRRELGVDNDTFEQQIQQIQSLMRLGKRTATYWLSLLQYDDGRIETAVNWFGDRVLDDQQQSFWRPAASYNHARALERVGRIDEAIEILKATPDAPQAHGNRLRSRLLADLETPPS